MALLTPLKGTPADVHPTQGISRTVDDGPPPSKEKAKPATPKGSLFQQASRGLADQNAAGLGAEGGDPQLVANRALAQVLGGVKILSTVLPGLVPILSDLTGRLTMIVPQMMADFTNGGTGLVPAMGMPLPQPGMGGGLPPGGPNMMPPGGGGLMPQGGMPMAGSTQGMPPGMPPPPQGLPPMPLS